VDRRAGLVGGLAGVALLAFGAAWFWPRQPGPSSAGPPPSRAEEARFIGSAQCASCHVAESRAWLGSQHQRAMGLPSDATVLGDFSDATFQYAGVTTRFFRRDGKFLVRTDGPDGSLADFEVKYTFGVHPLQQYLVELPRGHVQALSIAWDARPAAEGGQRWFHLYPDERIGYRDELHWTRRQQNWNFMCADCHSTDVRKRYDAATDSYATTYAEISVGCEACHGPGSTHVAWARTGRRGESRGLTVRFAERRGVAWTRNAQTGKPQRNLTRTTEVEIGVCAQCHARRAQLAEGYRAGRPFADHYLPAVLEPSLYYADGQQRDEVFIWGSWQQSRMHAAGVTCSDCHDPHSQKLRAPGNALCARCHDASKYDTRAHHHHDATAPGARCVECHMPSATYMVVDARRDHRLSVPRPDQSVALGVPNACNRCHRDVDARWAAARVRDWLGRDARGNERHAPVFAAAEAGDARSAPALQALVDDAGLPAIVRASALAHLRNVGPVDPALVARACHDPDTLVRLAAASLAEALPPDGRLVLTPLLEDAHRAVRIEAARVMAPLASRLSADTRAAWQRAADEYVATLRYGADRPEAHVALGTFAAALGRPADARAAFEAALRLEPTLEPAYVDFADVLRAEGAREDEVLAVLRRGLEHIPDGASLQHAVGLALVRQRDMPGALDALRRATELGPDVARYTYVYAVALHSAGRVDEAVKVLDRARNHWPNDRDVGVALATYQAQRGDTVAARHTLARLRERFPGDRDVAALAHRLEVRP
jgi:predicted CXXCH cytochrome family protein